MFYADPRVTSEGNRFHTDLVAAIREKNPDRAAEVMNAMLTHGEEHLGRMMTKEVAE